MAKTILIVGDEADPHIKAVRDHLDKSEVITILLNPYNGNAGSITYSFNPFHISFDYAGRTINHTEVNSVWWRLKPHMTNYPKSVKEFETNNFISREWQLSLEPLSQFLEQSFWINNRSADLLLRNKPYQLYRADLHGFKIPGSIISNDYDSILQASDSFEQIIYKPLGYFISPPDRILFSNKITKEELEAGQKNISPAPCIFQNYVEKDFELRITVVGNKTFAVKIHSQENPLSKSDWRRDQFKLKYEPVVLDPGFELKLLSFHKQMDLVYGAYDFIVDRDGHYVFLEVNPVGQWLWLENNLDLGISKQIAATLLR